MSIKFLCPACHRKIRVADVHGGRRGACPACKELVAIPKSSTLPDEESESEAPRTLSGAHPATPSATTVVLPQMEHSNQIVREQKQDFIRFNCPGCGKMTGFPAEQAGSPAACPACRVKLMIPERSGEDSFIIGGLPTGAKAPSLAPQGVRRAEGLARASTADALAVPGDAPPSQDFKRWAIAAVVIGLTVGLLIVLLSRNSPESQAQTQESEARNRARPSTPPAGDPAQAPVQKSSLEQELPAPQPPGRLAPSESVPNEKTAEPAAGPPPLVPLRESDPPAQRVAEPATPAPAEPPAPVAALKTNLRNAQEEEDLPPEQAKKETATPMAGAKSEENPPAQRPPFQPPVEAKSAKPALACATCQGTTHVPQLPPRPYVRLGTDPAPNPVNVVPWVYCPLCQRGRDARDLLEVEKARLAKTDAAHEAMQQLTGLQLLYAETRHVSLQAQAPAALTKGVGAVLDRLTSHLQEVTRSTLLTQTRPDTHKIIILWDNAGYNKLIDCFEKQRPGDQWDLARKSTGSMGRYLGYFNANRGLAGGPEHMALFQFSKMLMQEATDGKAPTWLAEGFASYSENTITQMNLCYSFTYELNEVRFGQNWNADLKKYAQQGKLKQWDSIFPLDLIGMKPLDYLTCYSMVSFFMKSDPKRFLELVVKIREGMESGKALEKVYSRPVKDLQMMWAQWAMR